MIDLSQYTDIDTVHINNRYRTDFRDNVKKTIAERSDMTILSINYSTSSDSYAALIIFGKKITQKDIHATL